MAPRKKRPDSNSGRCTKQNAKKFNSKKRTFNFSKTKVVATVNAYEPVIPSISESTRVAEDASIISHDPPVLEAMMDVDFLVEDNVVVDEVMNKTASSSKIQDIGSYSNQIEDQSTTTGYRLFDMEILTSLICSLACPECSETMLDFVEQYDMKKGLASYVSIVCKCCNYSRNSYTSKTFFPTFQKNKQNKSSRGMKSFEVNMRMVYAMRNNGTDYSGVEKFCAVMNLPKPMTCNNYDKMSNVLRDAVQIIAERTMNDAADSLKVENDAVPVNTAVSVDGSWQKRGFTSMNGVVTVISIDNGKILDTEAMSRRCKACSLREDDIKNDPESYNLWRESHICSINYEGSAPSMEPAGALRIFKRSIENRGLRYIHYYGDGDSKSYSTVKDVYGPEHEVEKFECIGHVQKRVGCRLRKAKKEKKDFGRGELKDDVIDRLQNYYGIAIRSNVGDLKAMKAAVFAALFHVASSEKKQWHDHCPKGSASWCGYQRDISNKTNLYKPGKGLSNPVVKSLKNVFIDLSDDKLLKKCLHGKTQNANESFNGMIWNRIPKTRYCGLSKLELAVYDAVAHFNIGRLATVQVLELLDIIPGVYTLELCDLLNNKRKQSAEFKDTPSSKKIR